MTAVSGGSELVITLVDVVHQHVKEANCRGKILNSRN